MAGMAKKKILIIDDTLETRKMTSLQLQEAGYDVLTAVDGVNALKVLKDNSVDLVITDFRMPALGGQDWLSLLNHHYPKTKKIVISGYPFAKELVPAGIPFLVKPIKWEEEALPLIAQKLAE